MSPESLPPPLPRGFYARPTAEVARDLLGKALYRRAANGELLGGLVTEAEAYLPGDRASHAFRGRTPRNAPMFGPPGHAYIYLIYGLHHCLNAVTETDGVPGAVLIRALQPFAGTPRATGPGLVCRALGLDRSLTGADLTTGEAIWFADVGTAVAESEVLTGPRVGIAYAQEWVEAPLRFRWLSTAASGRVR